MINQLTILKAEEVIWGMCFRLLAFHAILDICMYHKCLVLSREIAEGVCD